MTNDKIIEMAKQSDIELDNDKTLEPQPIWYITQEQLIAFARLIEISVREECAKKFDGEV